MHKYFVATTNKPALSYKVGEEIEITVKAIFKHTPIECKNVRWQLWGDDKQYMSGTCNITPSQPLVIKTSLSKPGFLKVHVKAFTDDNGESADIREYFCSAGAEVEKLEVSEPKPDNYDAFWQEIENKLANFTPEIIEKKQIFDNVPEGYVCYDVKISTFVDTPASGYITMPKEGKDFNITITFNGYGISCANAYYGKNTILAHFNAHGFENGVSRFEINNRYLPTLNNYGFNEEENKNPLTTYWYKMMVRNLCGLKYLKSLDQWNKKFIKASGGSQGALQATTVAAHDKDVSYLEIFIPWFCNLTAEKYGAVGGWRPKPEEGVKYFDTVYQAQNVTCPVNIEGYLGDYTCPPSTITTLYNAFKSNYKSLTFYQGGTHLDRPEDRERHILRYDPQFPDGQLKKGIYRHFKGDKYELLTTGIDSETLLETVVYKSVDTGEVWVRPAYMWNDMFPVDDKLVKRFELIEEK